MLALRVRGAIETEGGKRKVHPKERYTQKGGTPKRAVHQKRAVYPKGRYTQKRDGIPKKWTVHQKGDGTPKRDGMPKKGGILKVSIPEKEAVYLKKGGILKMSIPYLGK